MFDNDLESCYLNIRIEYIEGGYHGIAKVE